MRTFDVYITRNATPKPVNYLQTYRFASSAGALAKIHRNKITNNKGNGLAKIQDPTPWPLSFFTAIFNLAKNSGEKPRLKFASIITH